MTFQEIQQFISRKDYLFSEHADEERMKDQLTVAEIEQAIFAGEVIEERLDDSRGESRVVSGKSKKDKLIHVIIGIRYDKPVIVTVYLPNEKLWTSGIIRKRRKV